MSLAKGTRLIQGVEPPCMRIARRMGLGFISGAEGLEALAEGMLERR